MRYNTRMKKTDANTLPDDIEALKEMVLELKKRFAASSEGLPGQGDLFNEIEDTLKPDKDEVAVEQHIAYTRKVTRRTRLDASLPRKVISSRRLFR